MNDDVRSEPLLPPGAEATRPEVETATADADLLQRVAGLEEQVAYLEDALLRLRADLRMGDALAARALGSVSRQVGATVHLDSVEGPGSLANLAHRFKVAFEAGHADPPTPSVAAGLDTSPPQVADPARRARWPDFARSLGLSSSGGPA